MIYGEITVPENEADKELLGARIYFGALQAFGLDGAVINNRQSNTPRYRISHSFSVHACPRVEDDGTVTLSARVEDLRKTKPIKEDFASFLGDKEAPLHYDVRCRFWADTSRPVDQDGAQADVVVRREVLPDDNAPVVAHRSAGDSGAGTKVWAAWVLFGEDAPGSSGEA